MIREGYGESGIVNQSVYSRKQINAVFKLYNQQRTAA